jgi:capsular exopolysaccharide synthesis family protein
MTSDFYPNSVERVSLDQDQEGGLRLGRFWAALKRHTLLIAGITTLTASAAVLKAVTDEPTYSSSFELLTPPASLETRIISTLNPETLSGEDMSNQGLNSAKLKILTSPRVMEPIVEELQQTYPGLSYRQLVGNLRISPDQTNNILTVSFRGDNSQQVIDVLEVVSEAYVRYSLEDRRNDIYRGIDFVDEQLPIVRERVEELETELEQLRQSSNLIDPLAQGENLTQQLAAFKNDQLALRVQIQETRTLYEGLRQELSQSAEMAANSALLESERYQSLLNKLLEIDSRLAADLTLYLEGSPEIEVVEEQRENLQPLLEREGTRVQQYLASYIQELEDRDGALSATIDTLNQDVQNLSTVARQYNALERELEIATTNLGQFLTKREALRIDAAQRQTPWEILTPPGSPSVSSASAKRNLLLGTVLGLLLGGGAAILVDKRSGKIHTVEELKEAARIPLLASIPYDPLLDNGQSLDLTMNMLGKMEDHLAIPFEPYSPGGRERSTPYLEAIRLLSTGIRLSEPDHPIRSFTVSSANPNAGKSTISFHLGHAFASMGQKTLVVDTDLRRPSLHRFVNLSNAKGLTDYVSGDCSLSEVIVSLPTDENLLLVPSGSIAPDPIKILTSQRMENFLAEVHEKFDMVIFDTPPLVGFADPLIVARKTQGLLLTARLGQIKFSEMQTVLDELLITKVHVVGMVANYSKQESSPSYAYYQGYSDSVEQSDQPFIYDMENSTSTKPFSIPGALSSLLNKKQK